MSWHERMNLAINYIEDNLLENIDFEKLSSIVGQSPVNFQRTFSIVTDMSVHEYIRRRRLTLAAFELQNSKNKVIDIAFKFGYESPEAFARAFKEVHGTPPSLARREGTELITFPRITFLLTVKGDIAMDYRIESKEAFSVYGIEGIFSMEDDSSTRDIPKFWQDCMTDGRFEKLAASTGGDGHIHAVCGYRAMEGSKFPYMLFAFKTENSKTDGYTQVDVPAATWAIFKTKKHTMEETSGEIQGLIKRVYTDWLPTASYNQVYGYDMELYWGTEDGMCYCETWIRVEKK
ncbi:MAG: AraC family transcriptional regulator [Oscillospiraceae bacterium]|nr:AraC family transcriptional regulator [Oscillospiraceae bacterium]